MADTCQGAHSPEAVPHSVDHLIAEPADGMMSQWPGCHNSTQTCLQGRLEGHYFAGQRHWAASVPPVRDRPRRRDKGDCNMFQAAPQLNLYAPLCFAGEHRSRFACLPAEGFYDMRQRYLLHRCADVDYMLPGKSSAKSLALKWVARPHVLTCCIALPEPNSIDDLLSPPSSSQI